MTTLPTLPPLPEDIATAMEELKVVLGAALERQRSQLVHSRQEVNRILKELEEDSKGVSHEIESHMARQHDLRLQLTELDRQIEDSKTTIAEYSRRRAELETKAEEAQRLCTEVRGRLEEQQSLRRRQVQHVMEQSVRNVPELAYLEDLLGLRIEAVVEDKLRFVFVRVDPNAYLREFAFVLDMAAVDYGVEGVEPPLEAEEVSRVVAKLNASRNFPQFLKDMRQAFKEAVNE
ncbi:putative kinetochore protein [Yarrowia sp. B02]|nr:putative kinetochore protein [Yarrowia sp. B02]